MKAMIWSKLTAIIALGTAVSAVAGPIQPRDVAGDPAWVLHLDCDGLRQTALGKFVLSEMDKPEATKKLAAFETIFSFDPRKELHGLTLYGSSKAAEDGVLLVYADIDADRLTTLAEGAKEHESARHGKHTIHSWIDDKRVGKEGGKPRTYAAIHNGKVVIFAQKNSRVAEALDVLDGTKPNLKEKNSFTGFGSEKQAFLIGAARKVELPASDPSAAVLRQAKMFRLSAGEANGQVELTVHLKADNEEIAKQMESVGRGLVSLLALQKEKPHATRIAQALSIQQTNADVVAKLALPADEVVTMMKEKQHKKSGN